MLAYSLITTPQEKQLFKALQSINARANEIYLTYTQPPPSTSMAQRFSNHITNTSWTDSFSEARNYHLPDVQKRADIHHWMFVDSDDQVVYAKDTVPMLEDNVNYMIMLSDALTGAECWQLRIFANNPELHWVHRVHEEVENLSGPIQCLNTISIVHHGYTDPLVVLQKHQRNLRLLELEFTDRKDDPHYHYLAGLSYRETNQIGKALDSFKNCYYKTDSPTLKARTCYERALCFKTPQEQMLWVNLGLQCDDLIELEIMAAELAIEQRALLVNRIANKLKKDAVTVFPINKRDIEARLRRIV